MMWEWLTKKRRISALQREVASLDKQSVDARSEVQSLQEEVRSALEQLEQRLSSSVHQLETRYVAIEHAITDHVVSLEEVKARANDRHAQQDEIQAWQHECAKLNAIHQAAMQRLEHRISLHEEEMAKRAVALLQRLNSTESRH
jgi:chromosome segregation ATPase